MNKLEKKYFHLRYEIWITEFKYIASYLGITVEQAKKEYKALEDFYTEELKISKDELKSLEKSFSDYKVLQDKYYRKNIKRKEIFSQPKRILEWYREQNEQCQYCGITQQELYEIVDKYGNLTLNGGTKRSKGTLEIEKRDSSKEYTFTNIILACPLCNNAKSNLIDEDSWRDLFVKPMRKFYEKRLGKTLSNDIPK